MKDKSLFLSIKCAFSKTNFAAKSSLERTRHDKIQNKPKQKTSADSQLFYNMSVSRCSGTVIINVS